MSKRQNLVLCLQKQQFITLLIKKYYKTKHGENVLDPYKLQQEASRPTSLSQLSVFVLQ